MEKITFKNHINLVERMMEDAEKGDVAYAVCFLDDAVEVMRELLKYDGTTVGGIEISQEDYNGYSKEYYVSIDGDMIVDVAPAWHEANEYNPAGYYWFDAEKIYIVGEANSAIIKNIEKEKCYEIEFEAETDEEDFIEQILEIAKIKCDEDGVPVGITIDIMELIDMFFGE